MKYAIEDVADSCWGVKDVENQVRVPALVKKPFPANGWRQAVRQGRRKEVSRQRAEARKRQPINSALMPGIEIDIRQVVVFYQGEMKWQVQLMQAV